MREYKEYPRDLSVETPIGTVALSITDGHHIYVDFNSDGRFVTIRGAQYTGSLHLNYADGKGWGTHSREGKDQRASMFMSKRGSGGHSASASAQAKACEVLTEAVRSWVATKDDLLTAAEEADINNDLLKIEEERVDIRHKLKELDEEHRVLSARLSKLVTKGVNHA